MKHVVHADGLYKCSPGVSGSRNLTDCSAVKGICFFIIIIIMTLLRFAAIKPE